MIVAIISKKSICQIHQHYLTKNLFLFHKHTQKNKNIIDIIQFLIYNNYRNERLLGKDS
ncbi:MAG: hypothetical protein PWP46_1782 [Fusobacteriaceae bacterium]|nr:hypothetical protein [Fusobacteriales bacterium]MDN5304896.1 hypothetical protein [Fusobacteriaceae bacterium]